MSDWQNEAACREVGPEAMDPRTPTELVQARAVCRWCPVQYPCLVAAMTEEQGKYAKGRWGVRAGYTPGGRARLAAQVRRRRAEQDRKHDAG